MDDRNEWRERVVKSVLADMMMMMMKGGETDRQTETQTVRERTRERERERVRFTKLLNEFQDLRFAICKLSIYLN